MLTASIKSLTNLKVWINKFVEAYGFYPECIEMSAELYKALGTVVGVSEGLTRVCRCRVVVNPEISGYQTRMIASFRDEIRSIQQQFGQ